MHAILFWYLQKDPTTLVLSVFADAYEQKKKRSVFGFAFELLNQLSIERISYFGSFLFAAISRCPRRTINGMKTSDLPFNMQPYLQFIVNKFERLSEQGNLSSKTCMYFSQFCSKLKFDEQHSPFVSLKIAGFPVNYPGTSAGIQPVVKAGIRKTCVSVGTFKADLVGKYEFTQISRGVFK